uniref:BSD domain-containing protein n=1 Tax=Noccaea caerulescens TaxID=107243 RepID=A0A1J3JJF8_NOCCA
MAWLARSIANSLKIDEDDDDGKETIKSNSNEDSGSDKPSVLASQSPRGVKEDISELTKTFRSQLWGVASFLAPPPDSSDLPEKNPTGDPVDETRKSSDLGEGDEDLIAGIRNDIVEIGGRFRTGISKISGNIPVSGLTKMASNFLQLGKEGADSKELDVGDAIGVTEEVVGFARDLALHPETWLDFPFPGEDEDFDDFEMTDAQYEHALAVDRLASSLAALRIELCPAYMSENCFWRIYFVLVHPKFSKEDALLLSTSQVLESRAQLSHELLHKRNKATVMVSESSDTGAGNANVEPLSLPINPSPEPEPVKTIIVEAIDSIETSEFVTEKHPIESKEIQVVDKPVIEERPAPAHHDKPGQSPVAGSSPRVIDVQVDDDADDWLKDEDTAGPVNSTGAAKHVVDEDEDVSFSDLEEDDDVPVSYKK